jgi:hypothetical protein
MVVKYIKKGAIYLACQLGWPTSKFFIGRVWQYAFRNNPYLILTDDWVFNSNQMKDWDGASQVISSSQSGAQLLIISKPNIDLRSEG